MKRLLLIVIFLLCGASSAASEELLYVFNWSEYMPMKVLSRFQKETGIKVIYSIYNNNETMFAKLKIMGPGAYDIAVPSTYYVDRMRKEGMLHPLDKSLLPNFKHLDPGLLNKKYDPENTYSVPYLWGSTGISINTEYFPSGMVKSWKHLWHPRYREKVLLIDDLREVFGMGLKVLGYSINDTDPDHIRQTYEKLLGLMPNVRLFNADSPKQSFVDKEVWLGMNWNGEALMAERQNPKIQYIYPKEGAMLWMDSMVIPKGSKHIKNAHRFLNFLLRPDIAAFISSEIGYATPNKTALSQMHSFIRDNKTIYPDEDIIRKGEFQLDVGEAIRVYEEYWEKLKAGGGS